MTKQLSKEKVDLIRNFGFGMVYDHYDDEFLINFFSLSDEEFLAFQEMALEESSFYNAGGSES